MNAITRREESSIGNAGVNGAATGAEYKTGMRFLAAGCSIIASEFAGDRAGLTATAVVSVTAEPPRLIVCINHNVRAYEIIARSAALSINVVAASQDGLARRFAGMVPGVQGAERFNEGIWVKGRSGAPVLADALASFDCRVVEEIPASTHAIFLCEVLAVAITDPTTGPLVFFNGQFATLPQAMLPMASPLSSCPQSNPSGLGWPEYWE
ncbi:MAG: flavin reductase family protein [Steroidobacteraceae bacterium]